MAVAVPIMKSVYSVTNHFSGCRYKPSEDPRVVKYLTKLAVEEREFHHLIRNKKDFNYFPVTVSERGNVFEIRWDNTPIAILEVEGIEVCLTTLFLKRIPLSYCLRSYPYAPEDMFTCIKSLFGVVLRDMSRNHSMKYHLEAKAAYIGYYLGKERNPIYYVPDKIRKLTSMFMRNHGSQLQNWISNHMVEGGRKLSYLYNKFSRDRHPNLDRVDISDPVLVKDMVKYVGLRELCLYGTYRIIGKVDRYWASMLHACRVKAVRKFLVSHIPVGRRAQYLTCSAIHKAAHKYNPEPWRLRYMLIARDGFDFGPCGPFYAAEFPEQAEYLDAILTAVALADRKDLLAARRGLLSDRPSNRNFYRNTVRFASGCCHLYIDLRQADVDVKRPVTFTSWEKYYDYIHTVWNRNQHLITSKSSTFLDEYSGMELSRPCVDPPEPLYLLTSLHALGAVGSEQRHCLGAKSFYKKGVTGRSYFIHLSSAEDGGATAEVSAEGHILQVHGPCNVHNASCDKLRKLAEPWLEELKRVYSYYTEKVQF